MVRTASALGIVLVVAVAALWCIMTQPWSSTVEAQPERPREQFAADRAPAAAPLAACEFDAKRAMGYLESLCKIGPRISGTEGMKKQQEMLQKHFEAKGAKVEFQRFTARQNSENRAVEMANLIAVWNPEATRRIILCAHYDTRPIADQEPDRRRWRDPFVSANDGGSGVALLMELAHHMKGLKSNVGVDFVLFDGEEYIFDRSDVYFFGSDHFGKTYKPRTSKHQYVAAVLLDMIGGKNARFPIEGYSWNRAGALVEQLWGIAAELKCKSFERRAGPDVQDDHLALNRAGIPAVDIIDFDYPHWHRLSDTPENCSGETLDQVARVLWVWLQRVK